MTAPKPAAPFQRPPSQPDLPRLEQEILQFWRAQDIEGKSLRTTTRADGSPRPAFVFYDGPPFATGLPLVGMLAQHQFVVHLVNVVAGEYDYVFRTISLDDVEILVDRIGSALIPLSFRNALAGG